MGSACVYAARPTTGFPIGMVVAHATPLPTRPTIVKVLARPGTAGKKWWIGV